MPDGVKSYGERASRQAQLQRALGDWGEVLPRVARGGGQYSAAGWYARIDGELFYLGDHTGVAFVTIARLIETLEAAEEGQL